MNDTTGPHWPLAQRVGFRFLFCYLVLFFFPFPSGLVNPWWLGSQLDGVWGTLVPWFGRVVLGVTVTPLNNGSGDTRFDYVRVAAMIALAALGTLVWSIVDRRRSDYRSLYRWTRIWLRYALAACMLTFGTVKLLMIQFEPPGYGRLIEPLGQYSPMALLWTFMGTSKLYTAFSGGVEVLGGVLLFFRRTTTLGALIVAGAMAQVVTLNLAYDVPVKLGSLHVLLLAIVLLAAPAELRRLLDFFVRNRPTQPADLGPELPAGRPRRVALALKVALIVVFLTYLSWDSVTTYRRQVAARDPLPVAPEGWYRVLSISADGRRLAPLDASDFRWRALSIRDGRVSVRSVDGSIARFRAEAQPGAGAMRLLEADSGVRPVSVRPEAALVFTPGDSGRATLRGVFAGHAVAAELIRENPGDFPLTSRGFRWVSAAPFFR